MGALLFRIKRLIQLSDRHLFVIEKKGYHVFLKCMHDNSF